MYSFGKTAKEKQFHVLIFFALFAVTGASIYEDYGVSWDEPISRANGGVNVKYVGESIAPFLLNKKIGEYPDLEDWHDKDYGVAFEMPAVALEHLFGLEEEREAFLFRHLITFIVYGFGVFALYGIASRRFGDYRIGLLAAALLILSPRFFAESFYNSKDIVFMAAFTVAVYTMISFLTRPSVITGLIHGFATAFAIDVRIMGIIIVVFTVGTIVTRLLKSEVRLRTGLIAMLSYASATCLLTVAMFPFLWEDPVGNFLLAFENMSRFRWEQYVRYMGDFVMSTEVPWHYIPVWILITTPPLYLGLFLIGALAMVRQLVHRRLRPWSDEAQMQDMLFLALFFGPIAAVIIFNSVLYDGWRQMYFIYPALILVAVHGFVFVTRNIAKRSLKAVIFPALFLTLAFNAYWMYRAHPLQNVYFNVFAGTDWKESFELDYWGLGNTDALRHILENDESPLIPIHAVSLTPLDRAMIMLLPEQKSRLKIVDDEQSAKYVLNNYRLVADTEVMEQSAEFEEFYRIRIFGETILTVFKNTNYPENASLTRSHEKYSADEFRKLSLAHGGVTKSEDGVLINVSIINSSDIQFAALSATDNPIRVSWRFADAAGNPMSGWNRRALPFDIPAYGELSVQIPLDTEIGLAHKVHISLVQEGVFWGHDIGMSPLTISLR